MSALTHDDLVSLLRRTTDRDGWLDPLLADADGGAAMGALIEVFARVSEAADYDCSLGLISAAPGGSPGTSLITMTRTETVIAGVIPRGYQFIDPRGVRATTQTDVPVALGQATIVLPVETLRETEMVNTYDDPEWLVDPTNPEILNDDILYLLIAPLGAIGPIPSTFQTISESTPIWGGTSDWLSLHGAERGVIRQASETTDAYRARVRNIPDAVSPIAVADGVLSAASRAGLVAHILEPFDDGATALLKQQHGLGTFYPLFMSGTGGAGSPGADFLDDTGIHGQEVDRRSALAYFRIELDGSLFDKAGEVLYLDDGYADDYVLGYPDVSYPAKVQASAGAIWGEANSKKAAGVSFDVYLNAYLTVQAHGHDTSAGEVIVFAMTAPPGHNWFFIDMIVDHDASLNVLGTLVPAGAYHRVRFTFDDATTFTTPPYLGLDSEHLTPAKLLAMGCPTKPITIVEGLVHSDGAVDLNLVGTLYVLDLLPP